MNKKLAAIQVMALIIALISSCNAGDLGASSTINIDTTVKSNGSVLQMLSLETNTYGLTIETAESWLESLKGEGWDISAISSSGLMALTAQREFSYDEFQSYVPSYQMVASSLQINNYFVYREYKLHMSLRALSVDEEGAVQDSLLQIIDLALVEQRLKIYWSVTMPGTLTDANTERISGSSATWVINSSNIMQGIPVTISSRSVNRPGVAGVISGTLLLAVLFLVMIRRRRKKLESSRYSEAIL